MSLSCRLSVLCAGGMTENQLLMQFQADMLELPVLTPHTKETTSLGAGWHSIIYSGTFVCVTNPHTTETSIALPHIA